MKTVDAVLSEKVVDAALAWYRTVGTREEFTTASRLYIATRDLAEHRA